MILGVAGAPGAGKSTVSARILAEAESRGVAAVIVPMDGWHLAHATLERLGRVAVKGAPETFDAHGFVHLVERIHAQRAGAPPVWAPEFRREIEDAVSGAVEVRADHRLVVLEGNYLLLDEEPWRRVPQLIDEAWFLRPSDAVRQARLIARHEAFGRDEQDARTHALGSDEANAHRVAHERAGHDAVSVTEVDPG